MALNSVQIQAIIRSTIGHLGHDPNKTNLQIRDAVAARLGIDPGPDYIAAFNYVRQGRRLFEAGEAAETAQPNLPVEPRTTDPTINNPLVSYRYRTIVVVDPGDGTPEQRHFVIVDSAVSLTPNEIRDEATAEHNTNSPDYPGRVIPGVAPPGGSVRVEILTAGRR